MTTRLKLYSKGFVAGRKLPSMKELVRGLTDPDECPTAQSYLKNRRALQRSLRSMVNAFNIRRDKRKEPSRAPKLLPMELQERSFAEAMCRNGDWLREHEAEILQEHPEWKGQWVSVATCTESKIVAVARERYVAIEKALQASELIEAAKKLRTPPDSLVTAISLGDDPLDLW